MSAIPGRQDARLTVERISRRLYAIYGAGGNVLFLVTDAGVLVVDTGNGIEHGRDVAAKIEEVTRRPIRYVVLSHYHGDHVLGAMYFPAGATTISHARTRENMRRIYVENALPDNLENPDNVARLLERRVREVDAGAGDSSAAGDPALAGVIAELNQIRRRVEELRELEVVLPRITFFERMPIWLGGESVELLHFGPCHTDGDVVVFFPSEKTVYVGDLLFTNGWIPRLDGDAGGSALNCVEVLGKVTELDAELIVPGHGRPIDRSAYEEALAPWIGYLVELRDSVSARIGRGLSLEDMRQTLQLSTYEDWGLYHELLPYNIDAVYSELLGHAKGGG